MICTSCRCKSASLQFWHWSLRDEGVVSLIAGGFLERFALSKPTFCLNVRIRILYIITHSRCGLCYYYNFLLHSLTASWSHSLIMQYVWAPLCMMVTGEDMLSSCAWTLVWPRPSSFYILGMDSGLWVNKVETDLQLKWGSFCTSRYAAHSSEGIVVLWCTCAWIIGNSVAASLFATSSMYPNAGVYAVCCMSASVILWNEL